MAAPQQLYTINGTAFMQLFGELHGFPSQPCLSAVCGIAQYTDENPPYPRGWNFSKTSGIVMDIDGKVYLVTNGHKYYIESNEAMNHYQLNGPQQKLDLGGHMALANLPSGPNISYNPSSK